MLGVRDVIRHLNYAELVGSDIIPFGVFDSRVVTPRKFPTIVYQTPDGRVKFGHFVEAYMRAVIVGTHNDTRLTYYPGLLTDARYEDLWTRIREYTTREYGGRMCQFDVELCGTYFAGHPDIIVRENAEIEIVDVKTTTNFEAMREETVLQLLAYAALARASGYTVKRVSVALPWNQMTLTHHIEDWNHANFLYMLESATSATTAPAVIGLRDVVAGALAGIAGLADTPDMPVSETVQAVGCHVRRADTLLETFTGYYAEWSTRAACQIFLAGNQFSKEKLFSDDDLMRTSGFIAERGVRVYIHAPYSINLSRPRNQRSEDAGETGSWALGVLRHNLDVGSVIGARGVVVHVGKPGTSKPRENPPLTVSEAKTNMNTSIREVLDSCSPECQLLIETPAGQGTELYTDAEELWDFWNGFTTSEKARLGICIDTCHVFAAGHDPLEYLKFWIERDSAAIGLIHFNDSKHERGSRKDRHAPYGHGHIGRETLSAVAELANAYGIPMVME